MKERKKLLAIILASVTSLAAITGCGQSPATSESDSKSQETATEAPASTNETKEEASTEEVTINFWHHYSAQSPENETLKYPSFMSDSGISTVMLLVFSRLIFE